MNKKSFSLIEVVIATGILLMFLGAGLLLTKGSLNSAVAGRTRIQVAMMSNKLVEEIRVLRDTLFFKDDLENMQQVFQNLCFDDHLSILPYFGDSSLCPQTSFRPFCYEDESLSSIKPSVSLANCQSSGGIVANRICLNKNLGAVLPPNANHDCTDEVNVFYNIDILAKHTGLGIDMMNMIIKGNWTDLGVPRSFTLPTYVRGCDKNLIEVSTSQPATVVHVYDRSDSMSWCWDRQVICPAGKQKMDSSRLAIAAFNAQLRYTATIKDKLGTAYFSATGSGTGANCVVLPSGPDSSTNCNLYSDPIGGTSAFTLMTNRINTITHSGSTPLSSGIARGMQILAKDTDPNRVKAMIITTDGIANVKMNNTYCQETPDNPCEQEAETQAQMAKIAGYKVFVIGIGGDVNADSLMTMASEPSYYTIVNATSQSQADQQLEDFYNFIFSEIAREDVITICPGNDWPE